MTLPGRVKNGVIVLDQPQELPEGAAVQIEFLDENAAAGESRTLLTRLGPIVGSIDDLPDDASINLKHYLYGHPKQ